MFLINAHPTRGRLLEYGRLIERGVYKIITGKRGAFIGDGCLKEHGRLLEKIRYPTFSMIAILHQQMMDQHKANEAVAEFVSQQKLKCSCSFFFIF